MAAERQLHQGNRSFLFDFALATLCTAIFGIASVAAGPGYPGGAGTTLLLAGVIGFAMPIALIWRRSRPVASAVAVYALALSHLLLGVVLIPSDAIIFVSLYTITVYGPLWARRVALGSAIFGCALLAVIMWFGSGPQDIRSLIAAMTTFALPCGLVLATWAIGLMRRARLMQLATLAERAARLERERDQQAQIAVAAERSRIAREMHDVVAHSLAVIIAQADGGRYAASTSPQAAVSALETIADTGRSALADTRRILGVLRHGGEAPEMAPQPAQLDVHELIDGVRAAGLEVSLTELGPAGELPQSSSLAVYRIVQESLTNILKHAGPHVRARVTMTWRPQSLNLLIEDDGRGAAAGSDGAGNGLVGMRERAQMLGGTLTAGPRNGGGFKVEASLPIVASATGAAAGPAANPFQPPKS